MGKQIRFYMFPKDEFDFWNFVSSIPGSYRLNTRSSNPKLASFLVRWNDEIKFLVFRQYEIGKISFIQLNKHLREGTYKFYSESKLEIIDTGEKLYWLDQNAPLIRFDSSINNDNELSQGRIWADFYSVENNQFVYKGDEFKELYETIAAWIRKNFKKIKGVDGYFGKDALAWYRNGGKLYP